MRHLKPLINVRLLTIYDLAVEATWAGKVGEDDIKGTVKVPEVSHEAIDGLSDYEVGLISFIQLSSLMRQSSVHFSARIYSPSPLSMSTHGVHYPLFMDVGKY